MRRFRCVLCLDCPLKADNSTLHRCGTTIPAPLQARQSCRFLETDLLFPPLAALRRFPLRAKSFLPEGELPRSGQEKPLWRAHMSRRKTDLNLFRAVRGTWAAVGSFAALRMRRTPCGCFRRAFLSNDPRRVSALWGSLAVVDVGVDGDVPQMFVLHIFHLLFSMKGPRGVRRAADQHTRPPCRPSDSGRRSRFAHSFALYAVLSIFASCFQGLFQKNRTIPQFS